MTPAQRKAQADEWRWWRKQNPAGARRAWRSDRDWIRNVLRKREPTAVVLKFIKTSAGSATGRL